MDRVTEDEGRDDAPGANAESNESPDLSSSDADATGDTAEGSVDARELRKALDELNDRYLRLAAEFDNFRKRSRTELADSRSLAQASLVGTLLDALDDFSRIVSLDPGNATAESLLEGMTLVERKLRTALGTAGLEEIDPVDEPFDPNTMEAMARAPAESEEEDDMVAEVFQRGVRFGGHLVRPARVSVRKYE